MRQMLAAFEERNEAPHHGKELRPRKMHQTCLAKVQSTGKEW